MAYKSSMTGKYSSLVVKDENKRLVEGFANVSVTDRQNDIVPTDAMFKAMLNYMNRGGIVLLSHGNKPVGKVLQWSVEKPQGSSAEGIHIIAQIDKDTGIGDDTWKALQEKLLTGFSIGGIATRQEEVRDKSAVGGVARKLAEIELHEISLVEIPANQLATVESLSMAKSAGKSTGKPPVKRTIHTGFGSHKEAMEDSQELRQEGYAVYRVFETDGEWSVEYGEHINPSTGKGDNPFVGKTTGTEPVAAKPLSLKPAKPNFGTLKPPTGGEVNPPTGGLRTLSMKAESAPTMVEPEEMKDEEDDKNRVPTVMDESPDGPRGRTGTPVLHDAEKEQNTNFDQTKYGLIAEKDDAGAVSSADEGVENPRYGPNESVEKPIRSRAQQGWLAVHRPDLLHRWARITDFSGLPEHVGKEMHPIEHMPADGVCDYCGQRDSVTEDKYGHSFCSACKSDIDDITSTIAQFAEMEKEADIRCPHCGSDTEPPKVHAPDPRHYRWCPMCKQHRYFGPGGVRTDSVHKDPRDGATADSNVGQTGLGAPYPTSDVGKGINTSNTMDKTMPKTVTGVRKDPDPGVETKSDTEILPYSDEEKRMIATHRAMKAAEPAPAIAPDENKPTALARPLEDEPAEEKGTAPVPHKTTADDFKFLAESLLKTINERFESMEKRFAEAVEKANYTSKPPSVEHNYPKPPLDGPKSDGLQAPKLDQEMNPHSKPFGKDASAIVKTALGGAGDGSKEGLNMGTERTEFLKNVLAKGTNAAELTSRRLKGGI